jgi:hypothetical protein
MFGSSQGLSFGSGGYATAASQDASSTPVKKVRQEDKQTCMPLTARLISDAVANKMDDGTELQIHGNEISNVALVGVVEGLVQQATGTEFVLNDATGRIKIRHFHQGDTGTAELACGRYVSLVGSVRMTPMLHVSALTLRPISSADDISYHMIEVAYAALKLTKGGSRVPGNLSTPAKQVAAADPSTPPKERTDAEASLSVLPAPTPILKQSGPLQGDALREAIVEVLRKEGDGIQEGVSISTVINQLKATPADDVRNAMEKLVGEGDVFATIDDDHFNLLA